jgi:hypothetical protein
MKVYAQYNPATFDLRGMSEQQMDALREGLVLLHQMKNENDPYSDEFEKLRQLQIAARDLIDATNAALRARNGDADE